MPTRHGRRLLARVARLAHTDLATLVERIRRSRVRLPYAPAVVLPHLKRGLADYLDERAVSFPGLHVAALPVRSYPQGRLGAEFLGLLGEIGPDQLKQRKFRGARPGEVIGQSGVEWQYDRLLNGGLERDRVAVDSLGRAVGPLRLRRFDKYFRFARLHVSLSPSPYGAKLSPGLARRPSDQPWTRNPGRSQERPGPVARPGSAELG